MSIEKYNETTGISTLGVGRREERVKGLVETILVLCLSYHILVGLSYKLLKSVSSKLGMDKAALAVSRRNSNVDIISEGEA